ncbi:hypothetical protein [Haliangium sp.]|uniref:hypothetical protein n=1 Tax=Haliangium sp. TaxID=2663208 RepID=UPI003D104ADE
MAYNIYPSVSPLTLAAGGSSGLIGFAKHPLGSLDPPDGNNRVSLYVRVIQLGGSAVSPSFDLHNDNGAGVTVPVTANGSTTTFFIPGVGPSARVTAIKIFGEPVYRLQIEIPAGDYGTGNWSLSVNNDDAVSHEYMWVVGSNNSESQQPWLFIEADAGDFFTAHGCHVRVGDTDNLDIQIRNVGTTSVTITDASPLVLGNFELTGIPPSLPLEGSALVTATFTAPSVPGISSETWNVGYTHTPAGADSPAPQDSVILSARHAAVEVVYVADASGSMARTPEGDLPGAGEDTRWDLMVDAVGNLMGELTGFADGAGTARVLIFPDISSITPTDPPADPLTQLLIHSGPIDPGLPGAVDTAFAAQTPISGKAGTAIIEAVIEAIENHFDTDPDAVQHNRRVLVLLTDGSNTHGRPLSTLLPGGTHAGEIAARNIHVVGVAYGRDDVTTPFHVDHGLVADIVAQAAGGATMIASDVTTKSLNEAFTDAAAAGLCGVVLADPKGVLTEKAKDGFHGVFISRYERRVGFVVNWPRQATPPTIELRRPDGKVITEKDAKAEADISYDEGRQRKLITLQPKFLGDPDDPGNPNFGPWILHVFAGEEFKPPVPYEWGVLADSSARLQIDIEDDTVFAGEPIDIEARFTVGGRPAVGVAATIQVALPAESAVNALARAVVKEDDTKRAKEKLAGADVTGIDIKAEAAKIGKVKLPSNEQLGRTVTVPLVDADGDGVYRASLLDTAVPGRYELGIAAILHVDGGCIRREHRRTIKVTPRPDPERTELIFKTALEKDVAVTTISVTPTDRFGNLFLVDPAVDDFVSITSDDREARFRGPVTTDFDGTYRREVEHDPERPPPIDVKVGTVLLFDDARIPVKQKLLWMTRVVSFTEGKEAKPGINKHDQAKAALCDATAKPADEFLALGAGGSVTLAAAARMFRCKHLEVFVHEDRPLRPYRVDVLVGRPRGRPRWVTVGKSRGITQRFRLPLVKPVPPKPIPPVPPVIVRPGPVITTGPVIRVGPRLGANQPGATAARPIAMQAWGIHAVRVVDLSMRIEEADGSACATPGVSIRGVGYLPW